MDEAVSASRQLPPEPRSVALARRFVTDVLQRWQQSPAVEVAALLVSEVVTNAVLHAGSVIELVLRRRTERLRVEVADSSPTHPVLRAHDDDATTGRGLEMVELLAEDWGVDHADADGKTVWFEVAVAPPSPTSDGAPAADEPPAAETAATPANEGAAEIQLPAAPVQLMATVQQHTEALLRELALYLIEAGQARRSLRLGVDFGELERQLRAAVEAGQTAADLVLPVTAASPAAVREVGELLTHGDALAAEGLLLCPPALPEVAHGRGWLVAQIVGQLEGQLPEAWRPQPPPPPDTAPALDHADVLAHLPHAVVAADTADRIVYVNAAGAQLLGWDAGELVGQRLTAIIPERLHHAHVAGYTRYLVTGQPRLIGTPVHVPARRRDGREVDVELALSAFTDRRGRQLFAAVLRSSHVRTPPSAPSDIHAGWRRALLTRLRTTLDQSAGLPAGERCRRLLGVLAVELGWQFAAWWAADGDALQCRATWQASAALDPFVAATTQRRFTVGQGLPGRVWEARGPAWLTDVARDANFPRAAVALAVGLRSGCGTPVVADGRVVGVVELLTTHVRPPDDALLATLAEVGELLGAEPTTGGRR